MTAAPFCKDHRPDIKDIVSELQAACLAISVAYRHHTVADFSDRLATGVGVCSLRHAR
jgi:hypothetical protein